MPTSILPLSCSSFPICLDSIIIIKIKKEDAHVFKNVCDSNFNKLYYYDGLIDLGL